MAILLSMFAFTVVIEYLKIKDPHDEERKRLLDKKFAEAATLTGADLDMVLS